ncbi:MAG TPA: hypothetical protein VHM20_02315 [Gammaproteobacteria bacterium]|jgi:chromosome segregation ATPase|nr:hypothetical protein [Gammaproteobacteria bacterium]
MQRNLFEIYQTKVQTYLNETHSSFYFDDVQNIEMYVKTAELMLLSTKENDLKLQNFILALTLKKTIEHQKKYQEFLAVSQKMQIKPTEEKSEEPKKPVEIKSQNMTLELVKKINELNKQNKDLKDKIYKGHEEVKELKNLLLEKDQDLENNKLRIDNLNQQIDSLQQHIHDLSSIKKTSEAKEELQVDKRAVENLIKKHRAATLFGGTWKLNRTISKLDELLNQDKGNPYITKSEIRNCIVSPDKLQFFQNPPEDRNTTSTTDKFICELADVFNKKNIVN